MVFQQGHEGIFFPSFLDATALLRPSRGFTSVTSQHQRVAGARPLSAPRGVGRGLRRVPGPRPPMGEQGLFFPVAMATTAPAHRLHVGHPAGAPGSGSLGAKGSGGRARKTGGCTAPSRPPAPRSCAGLAGFQQGFVLGESWEKHSATLPHPL